jgi:hypothetical protein
VKEKECKQRTPTESAFRKRSTRLKEKRLRKQSGIEERQTDRSQRFNTQEQTNTEEMLHKTQKEKVQKVK